MVATNKPIATKDTASPAASAAGPRRCSEAAAPSTTGKIGSTQGERIESVPATNARASGPSGMDRSEGLVQQAGNRRAVGGADGAARLGRALERDQRRLHPRPEGLDRVLLAVEVDDEVDEILEFRLRHQIAQDRLLRFAGRTPRGVNRHKYRLVRLLRRRKGSPIEGPGLGGEGRRDESGARGEKNGTACRHRKVLLVDAIRV